MKVTTVGIDLAKNVFQLHGVNELGKTVFKKQLRRDQVAAFFVNLPACLIGMEACGGAHYLRINDVGIDLLNPKKDGHRQDSVAQASGEGAHDEGGDHTQEGSEIGDNIGNTSKGANKHCKLQAHDG